MEDDADQQVATVRALILEVLVETGASMACLLDAAGSLLDARLPFPNDLGGAHWEERVDPDDRLMAADSMARLLADGAPQSAEIWVDTTVGRRRLALRGVNLLHDPLVRAVVVSGVDVTALRAVEADRDAALAELAFRATHDPLTGLANRALVVDRLQHALAQRDAPPPAVVFCDLAGFKTVNDRHGHLAGDEALQEVAQRLLSLVRGGDTVGRVGGDEFVLVCERTSESTAVTIGRRLIGLLDEPVPLKSGGFIRVGADVGVSVGRPGDQPEDLLRRADQAMYQSKRGAGARRIEGVRRPSS
jgi:diguanylate cyclase (GGDEF)-like protein